MAKGKQQRQKTQQPALAQRIVMQVLALPRITRILLAGVFALATAMALSPIIDSIYLRFFFDPASVNIPAFISAGFGLLMYFIGWQLIVGTVGEEYEARTSILWYFGVGILANLLVALWLLGLVLSSTT